MGLRGYAGRVFWNKVRGPLRLQDLSRGILHIHSEIEHGARGLNPLRRTESLDCTILT
jgi:hypothetical protein